MAIFKRSHLFQTIIMGIHVSFRGCKNPTTSRSISLCPSLGFVRVSTNLATRRWYLEACTVAGSTGDTNDDAGRSGWLWRPPMAAEVFREVLIAEMKHYSFNRTPPCQSWFHPCCRFRCKNSNQVGMGCRFRYKNSNQVGIGKSDTVCIGHLKGISQGFTDPGCKTNDG